MRSLRISIMGPTVLVVLVAMVGVVVLRSAAQASDDPTAVALDHPEAVVSDASGDVFIADTGNCVVRKVSGGVMTTVAGTPQTCGYSGDGGPATAALLNHPAGLARDGSGNLYIADTDNCRVRRVDLSTGTIVAFAGNGTCGSLGDWGPPLSASLNHPRGLALNSSSGDLYIADTDNCRVRGVTAGTESFIFTQEGGACGSSSLNKPRDVDFVGGGSGSLYIADTDNCVIQLKVGTGAPSVVAGTPGVCGAGGNLDHPSGVAIGSGGAIYAADTGNCRLTVTQSGTTSTFASTGTCGNGGDGTTTASFDHPRGIDIVPPPSTTYYVADTGNCRVRRAVTTWQNFAGLAAGCPPPPTATATATATPNGDSDGDGVLDTIDNCPSIANADQSDRDGDDLGDVCELNTQPGTPTPVPPVYGTNPDNPDTDGDNCGDGQEVGPDHRFGGQRDPLDPWDFYDVPVPALRINPSGVRDHAIGLTTDVVALQQYFGVTSTSPYYTADYDNNGVQDGLQYDRSTSTTPGMPWRSGPPDGGIGVTTDYMAMRAQIGDTCYP